MHEFAYALTELPIDNGVRREACGLVRRTRVRGVTVPAADVLIVACARYHGAALVAAGSNFAPLASVDS